MRRYPRGGYPPRVAQRDGESSGCRWGAQSGNQESSMTNDGTIRRDVHREIAMGRMSGKAARAGEATALAKTQEPRSLALTPSEMPWISQGPLVASGMEQLNLVGNPSKPGPYTLRLKFPKGLKI